MPTSHSKLPRVARVLLASAPLLVSAVQAQSPVTVVPRPAVAAQPASSQRVASAPAPAPSPAPAANGPAPAAVANAPAPAPAVEDRTLVVDQAMKTYHAKPGELETTFVFRVSNTGNTPAVITDVKTSCGCTVAKLPSKPWVLSPFQTGDVELVVDLSGKSGNLVKTATIETVKGNRVVTMQIMIPPAPVTSPDSATRDRNMQVAAADRQAVFKGDCVRCHVTPAAGLTGEPLYRAACAVCHEGEHRASMVPDLRNLAHETNRDFWRAMIVAGKPGTLMPGFSADMGGPLNRSQIDSLVEYLAASVPSKPAASVAAPTSAAAAKR